MGEVVHGEILFSGQNIDKLGPEKVATLGIRPVIEGQLLYEQMNVEEKLLLRGSLNRDRQDVKERFAADL